MQVYFDKLKSQLQSSQLPPLYLVAGDEILLSNDACDAIRSHATAQGFTERELIVQDAGFNWSQWLDSCYTMSLFASKRVIELRLQSSKIGTEGAKAFRHYFEHPADDVVVLVSAPRIEGKPKWLTQVIERGTYVPIYPLDSQRLPAWLFERARSKQLTLSREACQLLAERVEGNLMSAEQELEKLVLLIGTNTEVSVDTIVESVADSARFSAFNMFDKAIAGEALASCRALLHLKEEGSQPVAVIAAVSYQLRQLESLKQQPATGGLAQQFRSMRIPAGKQRALGAAVQRLSKKDLRACHKLASRADILSKRGHTSMAWQALELMLLRLAGQPVATERDLVTITALA